MGQIALPQIDSPVESYGKMLQLRQLTNSTQAAAMQQQAQQQALSDDASYRTALQSNPDGGPQLLRDLATSGNYKGYAAAQKADLETRKGNATIANTQAQTGDMQAKALNQAFTTHRDLLNTVNDPQSAAQWVASAYQDPVLGPLVSRTGPVEAAVSRIPQDPAGFAAWKQQASLNAEKYVTMTTQTADNKANNDRIASEGDKNRKNALVIQDKIGERQDSSGMLFGAKGLAPEATAALTKAVEERRLDPNRINSRTAQLYADMALKNPTLDFSKVSADINLGRNAGFQQKAMVASVLPEIMQNMVTAGQKLNFSDVKALGKMQGWVKGELNDPEWTDYMTQRNDALMSIAGVMRGNGMTDMAHKAELEVSNPTMAPAALSAWLQGQMRSLTPRLKNNARIMHTPVPGEVPPAAAPGAAPANRPSLDTFFH